MRPMFFLFVFIFSIIQPSIAQKIDGRPSEYVPILVEGIEYKILKFHGTTSAHAYGWMDIEIVNKTDSVVIFDLGLFNAINSIGDQLNAKSLQNFGALPTLGSRGQFKAEEIAGKRFLRPSAKISSTVYFDGPLRMDKVKPFTLYWGKHTKIAEVFK